MHGACKCNVGYSGDCCEYTENTKKGKVHISMRGYKQRVSYKA